jgi:hypothetical protein
MKPEEILKLSDRELLVKTFGTVEWLKGVMGNGGGVLEDIRQLQKAQNRYITRGELMLTVGIISVIFAGIGALVIFL